ncbi:hypothetical protein KIH87_02060 [Paraneptunicella aestuarii]|uniref:hypothetical protein n=1 Tax=Paraneptunicella aestuarii TaxID=2831148 RepID=UPI001E45A1AF|nr:hypothetical protein [Paraneptunicella aestuarii]UAA39173.1 hypothetical protein KIH87_02060 [Paraneptunicella aestuarii]
MSSKFSEWMSNIRDDCIGYDLERMAIHCAELQDVLPEVDFRFAIKACPQPVLLNHIARSGMGFDIASVQELDLALRAGVSVERIHFGNTIKSAKSIQYAYRRGIRDFVTDSVEDLLNIAQFARGSRVFCRIYGTGEGALWGLKDKFGCSPEDAVSLLIKAKALNLVPAGISVHVGSQQLLPEVWKSTFDQLALLQHQLLMSGIQPLYFNLGGGLPASGYKYPNGEKMQTNWPLTVQFIQQGIEQLRHVGGKSLHFMMEPGRSIVADFGVLRCHVVRFSERVSANGDKVFWLYLSAGRFNGLYEADALQYELHFPGHSAASEHVPAILAGPTCDSDDVINKGQHKIAVPKHLREGDPVWFLSCGAYSSSYATAFFNGFTPLPVKYPGSEEHRL